jgi:hypothetical protein
MGMSRTSGGIGKKELSIKETPPRNHFARGFAARLIVKSYKRRSIVGPILVNNRSGCGFLAAFPYFYNRYP